jgi:crotonobetainyl-CoA:carnitine CoA-transferase CaiB-like acyl-CoA transferase
MTDSADAVARPGPLDGIRVVELATVLMAPYAAQLLGDLGADVIKVEGDELDAGRVLGGHYHPELSGVALNLQRNKRSLQLDLKQPAGLDAMRRLLSTADAFITNVRPGALARLGLDHASLAATHPHLVYCEAHGFWSDSPEGNRPAFDDIIQAETGLPRLLESIGQTTAFLPSTIADKVSGLYITVAVLAGLLQRHAAGAGQRIELAMFDAVLNFNLVEHIAEAAVPGGRAGYARVLSKFRGPHRTTDGWIAVLPYSDAQWRALYGAVGREHELDSPAFSTLRARIANADVVYSSLGQVMAERTTAEWIELCLEIGVPVAPVPTLHEIVTDPALHRGVIEEADHPVVGRYRSVRPPIRFAKSPMAVRRPAPLVGEHTVEILHELGFTDTDVEALLASRAARQSEG